MFKKFSYALLLSSALCFGSINQGLAVSLPVQNGKLNGTVALNEDVDFTFNEDGTFTSTLGFSGKVLCDADKMTSVFNITDTDEKAVELLKCVLIEKFERTEKGRVVLFNGGFHFPNFTQESQVRVVLSEEDVKKQGLIMDKSTPFFTQETRKYQTTKEVQITLTPQNDWTVNLVNLNGEIVQILAGSGLDVGNSLYAAAFNDEEALDAAILESAKDFKITDLTTLAPQNKQDISFKGIIKPFSFYVEDNSFLKLYNPDEAAVFSINRLLGKTYIDLKYPKSAKDMISFQVDTAKPIFSNFAKTLSSVTSMPQYKQMASLWTVSVLMEKFIVSDFKWLDANGNLLAKADQLSFMPGAPESLKGELTWYNSATDYLIFKFNGLHNIQLQTSQGETRTISLDEMTKLMLDNWKDKQVALDALFKEIEELPPSTYVALLYKGAFDGYTSAMNRHNANKILDYLSRCAVVASVEVKQSGSCPAIMDGEKSNLLTKDAVFNIQGHDLVIEVTPLSQDVANMLPKRSISHVNIQSGDNGTVRLIFKDMFDDSVLPQSQEKETKPEIGSNMTDDQVAAYLQAHPELIADYLKNQRTTTNTPKTSVVKTDNPIVDEITNDKTNSVMGNPNGSFIIVEFFDYNCGYCKMMNKKLAQAIKQSDNIRWILMDTPIFGERSEIISKYVLAAGKQGKFAEFHTALETASDKSEDGLKKIGQQLGLNVEQLTKDAHSEAIKNKLASNRKYTRKLNMGGVPMFIINGEVKSGAFSDEQMEEYIKQANTMKK